MTHHANVPAIGQLAEDLTQLPPALGNQLADEHGLDEAARLWEQGKLGPLYLLGSDIPGDIHFDASLYPPRPWWEPDLENPLHPPGWGWRPPSVASLLDELLLSVFGATREPAWPDEPPQALAQVNLFIALDGDTQFIPIITEESL